MATKKQRQRQLARARYHRRLERLARQHQRNRRWTTSAIAAVVVIAIATGGFLLASSLSKTPKSSASAKSTASATATPTPTPTSSAIPAMVDGECVYIKAGTAARKVSLPPATPDTTATYVAKIKTNLGNIVIDLQGKNAPCTVNSFVSLADQKYFNNTHCDRITTSDAGYFILQCGDPTGTGKGGPGYEFGNENLPKAGKSGEFTYTPGTVAMANESGKADSNGSQFFLVYKNSPLPPDYTRFGTIVSGLNIIQKVAKAGTDNSDGPGDGHPKEKVQIESVTITKT